MKLIEEATGKKISGSFYTPENIANFILKWCMNGNKNTDILEPSCGDGAFLRALKNGAYKYNSITGIEINKTEAEKAASIDLENLKILNTEFHSYCVETQDKFDLVIGNPPFVRYQYFDKKQQSSAETVYEKAGLKYSKLSNTWVSFIVGSSLLLKNEGKIGFVVPAEILQVGYAAMLRNFLAHFFNKIAIVSFKKLIFPEVQQEVVLLLCEKNENETHLIEHIELDDSSSLTNVDIRELKSPHKKINFLSNKWTFYFLEQAEIDFIEKLKTTNRIPEFSQFADAEVGITTGYNDYFTVTLDTVKKYDLSEYAKPLVGRSVQIKGTLFTKADWLENVNSGVRAYLLNFPTMWELKSNKKAMDYIKLGLKEGLRDKYFKLRVRDEWHIVPSARTSPLLFQRRNNIHPKLVVNEANAYTTDTMHRINLKHKVDPNAFSASYYNSLSLAMTEISGRSHGGGALELMPNEVEKILIPYNIKNIKIFGEIDKMFREGLDIEKILEFTDTIILEDGAGFTKDEVKLCNEIWKKLLSRRMNRGKS